MILRRNDKEILKASGEFWDKVWWNRHQNWLYEIETGKSPLSKEQIPILAKGQAGCTEDRKEVWKEESGLERLRMGSLER
jgi:hypothetical protein